MRYANTMKKPQAPPASFPGGFKRKREEEFVVECITGEEVHDCQCFECKPEIKANLKKELCADLGDEFKKKIKTQKENEFAKDPKEVNEARARARAHRDAEAKRDEAEEDEKKERKRRHPKTNVAELSDSYLPMDNTARIERHRNKLTHQVKSTLRSTDTLESFFGFSQHPKHLTPTKTLQALQEISTITETSTYGETAEDYYYMMPFYG